MTSETTENNILVGVDVGGTFTDFVLFDFDRKLVFSHKELTTPENPAEAILRGLPKILQQAEINPKNLSGLVHGSTVATNALLEGKGAKTALISTKGFRDIYQIGRQNRLDLYNLQVKLPSKLVSDNLRLEVEERILPDGHVETPLVNSKKDIKKILETNQVESVAISLLFSFANPKHEIEVSKWLESTGLFVSRSSEVLPEFREYERTSTTVINAYVSPVMAKYLNHLSQRLPQTPIRVMQSNGGTIRVEEAQRFGVRCILSGPAGGIAAAECLKKILSNQNNLLLGIITFDMGGTSTDVSLIKDKPSITKELEINHLPIGIPVLDIHTIGAGGGSIAVLDSGGALQVGPESAGADPGPACYGVGRFPTVTDANVFLGRLLPEYFVSGDIQISREKAGEAIKELAAQSSLDPVVCALGILKIANIHMAQAIRVISVERGEDPQQYVLLSYGGAGGLHAVELAREVGIPQVIIPPYASVFSAYGMLCADTIKDYSQTVMLAGDASFVDIDHRFSPMIKNAERDMVAENVSPEKRSILQYLDVRYAGQSFEITVPYSSSFQDNFHHSHAQLYGYARRDAPLEIVNLRVKAITQTRAPVHSRAGTSSLSNAHLGDYPVYLEKNSQYSAISTPTLIPFYRADQLTEGTEFWGPAVLVRKDTTILISQHDKLSIDEFGNIFINLEL